MLELVIDSRRRDLGGMEVGRILPWTKRRMVGPFIFLDHIGPVQFAPQIPRSTDVRPHPHIGLATVTYLFEGEIVHRDSIGCYQIIRPGEVNWMTAGRGISHSERFETLREHGGTLHGVQAWVALPAEHEEVEPAFVHIDERELPSKDEGGVRVRIIAGTCCGLTSPVQTSSPLFYAHAEMKSGASVTLDASYTERAAFIARGSLQLDGRTFATGQLLVFASGSEVTITAAQDATVMLLGGEPLGARHIFWNFVSSRPERIEQAKADWRAGRFALPVGDSDEFIPLPEEPAPRPEPMS